MNYFLQYAKSFYQLRLIKGSETHPQRITGNGFIPVKMAIADLARFSGMSESKLNRLFKQVFGHTIYNYHQQQRIHEAACLIRSRWISVSEAGYESGFANLSHFNRILSGTSVSSQKYGMQ